jgi:hypothetical protein
VVTNGIENVPESLEQAQAGYRAWLAGAPVSGAPVSGAPVSGAPAPRRDGPSRRAEHFAASVSVQFELWVMGQMAASLARRTERRAPRPGPWTRFGRSDP